jgi:hypothetical protein
MWITYCRSYFNQAEQLWQQQAAAGAIADGRGESGGNRLIVRPIKRRMQKQQQQQHEQVN